MKIHFLCLVLCLIFSDAEVFAAKATKGQRTPVKADCQVSGYSNENNKTERMKEVLFAHSAQVVNGEYDFTWSIQKLPAAWKGPKGSVVLDGSTTAPEEGWAMFSLYLKDETSNMPFPEQPSLTSIKLVQNTEFILSQQVNKTIGSLRTRWYLEARCKIIY